MLPELRRYIQHISLSPDSINNDDVGSWSFFLVFLTPVLQPRSSGSPESVDVPLLQAVSPLMKYLQDTMVILTENLMKENLTR